jgi:LmbE family N-acetylglucosaminyl deacetylase
MSHGHREAGNPPPAGTPPRHCAALIAALRASGPALPVMPRAVMVVAHPDDESVGAGSRLPRFARARLVYVTDGAPPDGRDAGRHALSPTQYGEVRRQELQAALSMCGIGLDQVLSLGCPDQHAALHMAELAARLAEIFVQSRAQAVLTHPYEGGHPDHDATAFAVHAAAALMRARGQSSPCIVEMTSYHNGAQGIRPCAFLPDPDTDAGTATVQLTREERQRKGALLACFRTQQETLRQFPVRVERFRPSPRYDFLRAPHAGKLFYECLSWEMTGPRFRTLAARAMTELRLEGRL